MKLCAFTNPIRIFQKIAFNNLNSLLWPLHHLNMHKQCNALEEKHLNINFGIIFTVYLLYLSSTGFSAKYYSIQGFNFDTHVCIIFAVRCFLF